MAPPHTSVIPPVSSNNFPVLNLAPPSSESTIISPLTASSLPANHVGGGQIPPTHAPVTPSSQLPSPSMQGLTPPTAGFSAPIGSSASCGDQSATPNESSSVIGSSTAVAPPSDVEMTENPYCEKSMNSRASNPTPTNNTYNFANTSPFFDEKNNEGNEEVSFGNNTNNVLPSENFDDSSRDENELRNNNVADSNNINCATDNDGTAASEIGAKKDRPVKKVSK